MPSRNGSIRPKSSLSEHVAREIQRDYPVHVSSHRISHSRRGAINYGARGIKRFVFATAGGVKRVSVATGRKGVKVGISLKRSVTKFTKKAPKSIPNNCTSSFERKLRIDGAQGSIIVSPPIIAEYTPIAQHSPFFTESQIHSVPPNINPASSIEELLRAYGVQPGPIKHTIPPPPAHAIFPPEYKTISRIHVRSRPGSARPFSRSSNRPFNPRHTPSVVSSRPSTRSDASSDVLGLVPLYEETGEIPSPWLRRPRMRGREERPSTAGSMAPKLRSRNGLVEVVSCATQTSPLPTVTSFPPNASIQNNSSELEISHSQNDPPVVEKCHSRPRRRKRNRSLPGDRSTSTSSHTNINQDIVTPKPRRRRKRREQSIQTIVEGEEVRSIALGHDHQKPRSNDRYSRASLIDIENVTEAMEEYYRSQGVAITPRPMSYISVVIPNEKDSEAINQPHSRSIASDDITLSPENSVERHPSIRDDSRPLPESRGRSKSCSSTTSKSAPGNSRPTQILSMESPSQVSSERIQVVSFNKSDRQPLRREDARQRYKEVNPNTSPYNGSCTKNAND